MKKQVSNTQPKPSSKVDPLVSLFLRAKGVSDKPNDFVLVHSGCIKKLPPKGWENYEPAPKKKRYIDSSLPLTGTYVNMSTHDLEDK